MLAAALLLAGCGHASAKDPFVGTWQEVPRSTKLVVAKMLDGYRVTLVYITGDRFPMLLARHGNELAGPRPPEATGWAIVLDYLPATGHLSLKSTGMGKAVQLSKLSDSTAIAGSPSPP
jgi:hypothetical protein